MPPFGGVAGGALVFWALVLYVPFLRGLFHFSPQAAKRGWKEPETLPRQLRGARPLWSEFLESTLHAGDLALCAGAGALSLAWFEAVKAFQSMLATRSRRTGT
jgi:hypothetical protein